MDPPPPPPPHGTSSGHKPSSGLPPGNYDIFIIPPHSSGSGFLYLPSLQPHRNSFLAGVACTLLAVAIWTVIFPVLREWFATIVASGGMGVVILLVGVGVAGWAWGKTQMETDKPANGSAGGASGTYANGSATGGPASGTTGGMPGASTGPAPGFNPQPPPGFNAQPPPGFNANPSPGFNTRPPPGFNGNPPPGFGSQPQPEFGTQPPPDFNTQPPPKPTWQKANTAPPNGNGTGTSADKDDWEKAREETRKKEDLRRRMEELRKKREEEEKEKAKQREKDAREREARERRENAVKERKEREIKERRERELKEARERREREAKEAKERREKEEKEAREAKEAKEAREAREAKEAKDAKEAEERRKKEAEERSKKEEKEAKERLRDPVTQTIPRKSDTSRSSSPIKDHRQPTARTATDDASSYSFRPYDKPKRPVQKATSTSSVYSESSYAPSQSTARTTPPPSNRGPYHTKDPDKIVIKAVYSFNNTFTKLPVAQLVSGVGSVTDGLVLRITTEGLFIDDDVRGVPQREWDVKAWTMKLVEVWCPQLQDLGATSGSAPASRNVTTGTGRSTFFGSKASSKVLTSEESDAFLEKFLQGCKSGCSGRFGASHSSVKSRSNISGSSQSGEYKGLHVLRASIRDQEGKRYVFVLQEEEGWKVAVGLQRLRRGTQ
ncbi:MAG: hypothetical protein Q9187_005552, partial [Circinaria calcarea]